MTRAFLLAVSGFALIGAACSPADSPADTANTYERTPEATTPPPEPAPGAPSETRLADYSADYTGAWGTPEQCAAGTTWLFSETALTTPGETTCEITEIEEGAGQVQLTGNCRAEGMEEGEQTILLALQDDGALLINYRAPVTVGRCGSRY